MIQKIDTQRKVYTKPRLIHYGEVRDITLGPSLGVGDSGMGDLSMRGFSNAIAKK